MTRGRSETTVRRPPERESRGVGRPTLRPIYTAARGAAYLDAVELEDGTRTIGRLTMDCLADDSQISRSHATLTVSRGATTIVDASTNGTFVNRRRIADKELVDGDVIRVGDSLLVFRLWPDDTPPEPVAFGLIGDAPSMHELRRLLKVVGPTDATVVVAGESGTGKELVARALHGSSRGAGPFVAVNCGAIAESLAESELFGHVAGAFTGAKGEHLGYFRAASGGVIFLDEVGELPQKLQPKLLRVLEDRAVTPVGSVRPVPCDIRVVAATNRDLAAEVEEGRFRGDLYARLSEITVSMPPLRERREDVLTLFGRALGREDAELAPDLAEALVAYEWPYNVRELVKVAAEVRIRGADTDRLELRLVAGRLRPPPAEEPREERDDGKHGRVPDRAELLALVAKHKGKVATIARETGRSRKQVYRWLETHAIDLDSYRDDGGSES